jgi:hypothetical protein
MLKIIHIPVTYYFIAKEMKLIFLSYVFAFHMELMCV